MAAVDVFISHRGPDNKRTFSVWLARELERRRFSCFFDDRSLQRGDPALSTMTDALSAAKVVVLVLSWKFFESPHCMRELRQSREQGKPVIPIYFNISPDQCKAIAILQRAEIADWGKFDGGKPAWETDIAWVAGRTGLRLEALDDFWDRCIDETINDVARILGRPALDRGSSVNLTPYPKNVNFVGREVELANMQRLLNKDGRLFVTGMGGMGKTQLVLEYVYRNKGRFAKVLWMDASGPGRDKNFISLAQYLGVQLAEGGPDQDEHNIRQVRDGLERSDVPCLVVLDSLEEEEGLKDLIPRDGLCQVVISTRLKTLVSAKGITLGELPVQEAVQLLKGERECADPPLAMLAERLGFLTVALAVSSRILGKGILPEELIERLDQKGALVFSKESDPAFGKCPDLVQLFDISLKMLNKDVDPESRLAELMLNVGGWFANASVRLPLLGAAALKLGTGLGNVELADAFSRLEQHSLGIRNLDGSVSFHQLVQTYGKYRGGQPAGKAMIEALKVKGQLGSDHPHFDHACRQVLPHLEHKLSLNMEELNPFLEEILLKIVNYYQKEGHYFQAKELINGLHLGQVNKQLRLVCQDKQGTISERCGDYTDAEALLCEVLKTKEKTLGPDHPDTLVSVDKLATALSAQGRHIESEELHRRALKGREARLGVDHPGTLANVRGLATALRAQGRHIEAEELHRRALKEQEVC